MGWWVVTVIECLEDVGGLVVAVVPLQRALQQKQGKEAASGPDMQMSVALLLSLCSNASLVAAVPLLHTCRKRPKESYVRAR